MAWFYQTKTVQIFSLFLFISSIHAKPSPNAVSAISSACRATQLPEICKSSLLKRGVHVPHTPTGIIGSAMSVASASSSDSHNLVTRTLLTTPSNNANVTAAAKNCAEFTAFSQNLIRKSTPQGPATPASDTLADMQAWMSAALEYLYDCSSDLRYVNTSDAVSHAIGSVDLASNHTSNALSMVAAFRTYGADMSTWKPPVTERSNPNPTKSPLPTPAEKDYDYSPIFVHFLATNRPKVTVAKHGGADFSTIQEAVDKAPEHSASKYVIRIKAGVYHETVRVAPSKTNIVFVGDGIDRTVLTNSLFVPSLPGPVTIYDVATLGVNGDGFMAMDMTVENDYKGPKTHQAVALRVDSDHSAFFRCAFKGHQDTLYAHALRQFYQDCQVEGTHDFIFGNAAALFYRCSLLIRPRQDTESLQHGEKDPVTAQGRTDPAQSTGLVFKRCVVNGTAEYMRVFNEKPDVHFVFLGRPWKTYARTVFMDSYMGPVVRGEGWMPWNGSFALDTLFYGEYRNYGPGAGDRSKRVPWSTQISDSNFIRLYSPQNFVQSNEWLSSLSS